MREVNIETVRSVDRAVDIMDAIVKENKPLTINEICKITSIAKATTYRLLYTLERNGLIKFNYEEKTYSIGLKVLEYTSVVNTMLDVTKEAKPFLDELQLKTEQTVLMAIPEGESIVYVYKKENKDGLKYSSSIGQRRPLNYGVTGRVVLAFLPEEIQNKILLEGIPKFTKYTETNIANVQKQLKEIKAEKSFVEVNQTNIGVTGIASPVLNSEHECVAVICVLAPSILLSDQDIEVVKEMVYESSKNVSKKLGASSY